MNARRDTPDIDQVTLAKRVAFDPATSGSVIGRLESKGWVARQAHPSDRRRKLLVVTPQGRLALDGMQAAVASVQTHILSPLSPLEPTHFVDLRAKLVKGHETP